MLVLHLSAPLKQGVCMVLALEVEVSRVCVVGGFRALFSPRSALHLFICWVSLGCDERIYPICYLCYE